VDKVARLAGGNIRSDGFGGDWKGDFEVGEALVDGCIWHLGSRMVVFCVNMDDLFWWVFGG